MYPMPTVIIVAVISFLIGSLLRSLLSPAEFVAEMPSGGEGTGQGGYEWREIKRLVEIKYLVGGWDFVVAVVRRPGGLPWLACSFAWKYWGVKM